MGSWLYAPMVSFMAVFPLRLGHVRVMGSMVMCGSWSIMYLVSWVLYCRFMSTISSLVVGWVWVGWVGGVC